MKLARKLIFTGLALAPGMSLAQVPDLLTALDAGGRAMGAGSALNVTGVSTLSATYNPAALAYIDRTQVGIAARQLPTTDTRVSGALNDLNLDTDTNEGDYRGTHIGIAVPLRSGGGASRGALGVAWTVGGWFHDTQTGSGLANGVATFRDFTRAQTDFINLSYGTTMGGNAALAWGIGFVFAQQNVRNFQRITFSDTNIPPQESDTDATGNGLGLQAGLLYTPTGNPDMTIGVTARTPIRIRDSASPLNLYDRIPGRIAGGIALRRNGFRAGGQDYMILAAEVQHFFDGHDSTRMDRENQTTGHVGVEYNYAHRGAVIPVRLGYSFVPRGGDDFDSRNAVTYGFGYRPNHGDWAIEVSFARPEQGGTETGLFFTYRFKR